MSGVLRVKGEVYGNAHAVDNNMTADGAWSYNSQEIFVVGLWEGEDIYDIPATQGKEVDGQASVVVIPDVKLVSPDLITLQVAQERVVCLSCGSPIFQ
jgi:hypothetical protein